jgi:ATP-dependent DNA helicase RecG
MLAFIRRNTSLGAVIKDIRREDITQYQQLVLLEAVLNALAHADYSARESPIHVAIFDDRLEITNPGAMPFGMSLEIALSGVSQLRNKVLGRVFRELRLTDQWGSGMSIGPRDPYKVFILSEHSN